MAQTNNEIQKLKENMKNGLRAIAEVVKAIDDVSSIAEESSSASKETSSAIEEHTAASTQPKEIANSIKAAAAQAAKEAERTKQKQKTSFGN